MNVVVAAVVITHAHTHARTDTYKHMDSRSRRERMNEEAKTGVE